MLSPGNSIVRSSTVGSNGSVKSVILTFQSSSIFSKEGNTLTRKNILFSIMPCPPVQTQQEMSLASYIAKEV